VTRIYVPLNRAMLAAAVAAGKLGPAPVRAYAVTPDLRAVYGAELDVEELEYAAYSMAVTASRTMLDADRSDDGRRLVAAADVETVQPRSGAEPGEVEVPEPIPWTAVAAVHADTEAIADATADDPELAWYATQEVPDLLR
jgi:hypothetical protein